MRRPRDRGVRESPRGPTCGSCMGMESRGQVGVISEVETLGLGDGLCRR